VVEKNERMNLKFETYRKILFGEQPQLVGNLSRIQPSKEQSIKKTAERKSTSLLHYQYFHNADIELQQVEGIAKKRRKIKKKLGSVSPCRNFYINLDLFQKGFVTIDSVCVSAQRCRFLSSVFNN